MNKTQIFLFALPPSRARWPGALGSPGSAGHCPLGFVCACSPDGRLLRRWRGLVTGTEPGFDSQFTIIMDGGRGARLLLERRGRVCVLFTIIIIRSATARRHKLLVGHRRAGPHGNRTNPHKPSRPARKPRRSPRPGGRRVADDHKQVYVIHARSADFTIRGAFWAIPLGGLPQLPRHLSVPLSGCLASEEVR